jgi:hypothetical protein
MPHPGLYSAGSADLGAAGDISTGRRPRPTEGRAGSHAERRKDALGNPGSWRTTSGAGYLPRLGRR